MSETPKKYVYTDDMDELSGFGGSYEAGCRAMVVAGLEWFDAHPDADPHYRGMKNVYGILSDDNEDAKALDAAIMDARLVIDGKEITVGEYGATGAMHQAAVGHVFWIRRNGWDAYVKESRERAKADHAA